MIAVWSIVLGGSLVVFAALIAVVFPRIFLKEGEIDTPPSDRGLKKVKEPNGKSILFEPSVEMRKYVRQYILSERGEKKVIVCRLDEEISYLDYDILLFDCLDRMFRILNVREIVEKRGYTREVELPKRTSYVALALNEVNDKKRPGKPALLNKGRRIAFAALLCTLIVAEIFLLKICCAHLFGGIFAESFIESGSSFLFTILLSLGAVLVNLICFILFIKTKYRKKSVGGKRR